MQEHQEPGTKELLAHVIGDMAASVSERKGETKQQQLFRVWACARMIADLLPRDMLEVTLAGHCMMFHSLLVDSAHQTRHGEPATAGRSNHSGVIAMNKAFHENLRRLEHYQKRPNIGAIDTISDQMPRPEIASPGNPADETQRLPPASTPAAAPKIPAPQTAATTTSRTVAPSNPPRQGNHPPVPRPGGSGTKVPYLDPRLIQQDRTANIFRMG